MADNKNTRITEYVYMIILLLYPLRKCFIGIDIMDAGYALGNYRFFDTMNQTWKLATYLANVTGLLLSKLPFGDTWIGMNVYSSLMIGIVTVFVYKSLNKYFEHHIVLFAAEIIALSVCWAPSTILYHYMGYLMMTIAVLLLYRAIKENNEKLFVIAGIVLGLCVAVRMPNVTYMALILPVWYNCWLDKSWSNAIKQTLLCVAGYAGGLVAVMMVIVIKYGANAYVDMISSLFAATDKATDYKPTAMLLAPLRDYAIYGAWLWLFAAYTVAGVILFKIAKDKYENIKKLVFGIGFLVLVRFCYGRGMFGTDYQDNFSIIKCYAVFLLMSIIVCIYSLVRKDESRDNKIWAVFVLVICFVTPLGSNNGIFTLINNLFIVIPVSVLLLIKIIRDMKADYPVKVGVFGLLMLISVQSILYGICFNFHETLDADKMVRSDISCSESTKGLVTNVDKDKNLNELGAYLSKYNLLEKSVILYGNIPAISYIFDMKPAVYTTWPDLDSNSLERLKVDLQEFVDCDNTVIIVSSACDILQPGEDDKYDTIVNYIEKHNFNCTFYNNEYKVYKVN